MAFLFLIRGSEKLLFVICIDGMAGKWWGWCGTVVFHLTLLDFASRESAEAVEKRFNQRGARSAGGHGVPYATDQKIYGARGG